MGNVKWGGDKRRNMPQMTTEHMETKLNDLETNTDTIQEGDTVCFALENENSILEGEVTEVIPGAGMGTQDEVHMEANEPSNGWDKYALAFRANESVSANGMMHDSGGEGLGKVTHLTIRRN